MVFGVTNDAQLCLLDKDSVFKRKEMLHVGLCSCLCHCWALLYLNSCECSSGGSRVPISSGPLPPPPGTFCL